MSQFDTPIASMSESRPAGDYRRRFFGPLLLALLALRAALVLVQHVGLIDARLDLSFPETAVASRALDAAQGRPPYHDWREWPHAFAPYAPLTYYVPAALARAWSPEPGPRDVLRTGRVLSLACLWGSLGLIYILARRLRLNRPWSLAAAVLPLSWPALYDYGMSFRPDAPRVAFELLALALMSGGPAGTRAEVAGAAARRACAGRILGVLGALMISFWFKPMAWAAVAIAAWWLWRGLGWRRAAMWMTAWGGAGMAAFFALDRHWDGLLHLNMVDSLNNGISTASLRALVLENNGFSNAILALGLIAPLLDRVERRRWRRRGLPHWTVPLVIACGLAQTLKVGSDINYYLDVYPLAGLAAIGWLAGIWRPARRPRRWPRSGALRELAAWALVACALWNCAVQLAFIRDDLAAAFDSGQPFEIERTAAASGPPMLVMHPFIAFNQGVTDTVLDYFQYTNLVARGRLDPRPLLERARAGAFRTVILYRDAQKSVGEDAHYSPSFLDALGRAYAPLPPRGEFQVWVPRKNEPPAGAF